MRLPNRVQRERKLAPERECPGHRAWVRRHHCCVPGCLNIPIECAHVRTGTDGGIGLTHHAEQHRIGERRFQKKVCVGPSCIG